MSFSSHISSQPEARRKQVTLLKSFMANPGRFSILVLGDHGVGKTFWLQQTQACLAENSIDCAEGIHFVHSRMVGKEPEEIDSLFAKAENGFLVIEDVEELSFGQQMLFFEALSTTDGRLGLSKKRDVRVVFSSVLPVEALRDSGIYLTSRFWDRISQLTVELPSFKDLKHPHILRDFEKTWGKMNFREFAQIPKLTAWKNWLTENSINLHGNFRDLDKLAILWHQYRILVYGGKSEPASTEKEREVFNLVRQDFEKYGHFPKRVDDPAGITFRKGDTYQVILSAFKRSLKNWSVKTYGSIRKASEELGIHHRTMDTWE